MDTIDTSCNRVIIVCPHVHAVQRKKNFHFQEVNFPFTYHGIQRRRRSSGLRNHRMRYITSGAVYGDRKRRCECSYITVAG